MLWWERTHHYSYSRTHTWKIWVQSRNTVCFGPALAKLVPGLFKLLPFKDESKILEPLTPEQA